MDNKLKNWADNFRPEPKEEVWLKIVVKKSTPPKGKLSLRPNVVIASILIIALCILIIALNYLYIFRHQANKSGQGKVKTEEHK